MSWNDFGAHTALNPTEIVVSKPASREFAVVTRVKEDAVAVAFQELCLRFRHGIFSAALLVAFVN